jgi:hypothetical protein
MQAVLKKKPHWHFLPEVHYAPEKSRIRIKAFSGAQLVASEGCKRIFRLVLNILVRVVII